MLVVMNKFLKLLVIMLTLILLSTGFVPFLNDFLKSFMSYEGYVKFVLGLVFLIFELSFYLSQNKKMKRVFGYMSADLDFERLDKEEKYEEDKNIFYREIPYDANIFKFFWVAFQYGLIKNRSSLLNALLLKWVKEKKINFVTKKKYYISENIDSFSNPNEEDLFNSLKSMGKHNFVKLSIFNSKPIYQKINNILLIEKSNFRKENKVVVVNNKDIISKSIKPDVDLVYGLKNYLLNFGSFADKHVEEVKLWEEYLIYAEMLGIAPLVKKQFRDVGIDYTITEVKFKKFNKKIINFISVLLFFSYILYGVIFLLLTSIIWVIYINFTWKI